MSFGPRPEHIRDWKRASKNYKRSADAVLGWDMASWYRTSEWRTQAMRTLVARNLELAATAADKGDREWLSRCTTI